MVHPILLEEVLKALALGHVRLRRVVDQDIEHVARCSQAVAEPDDLPRVAQVDADDGEPVEPLRALRNREVLAHRVVGEPAGHSDMRPVAQQHQRQLEADLTRPPVTSARRPARSARTERRRALSAEQAGHSMWYNKSAA